MPRYDYRCRTCDTRFEVSRPLDSADRAEPCPQGHEATSRVFTAVPLGVGVGGSSGPAPAGGGCCGGGCCS